MSDQKITFTRHGIRRGVVITFPLLIGLIPFALVTGVTAQSKGLSLLEALLMSATVFAGVAQLLALELWADPAPVLIVAFAALVVNIRLAPMGAALAFWLNGLRGWRLWGSLALMVDHSFALAVAENRAGGRDAGFLLGVGLSCWVIWVAVTGVGHVFGAAVRLPPGHWLFFAGAASFCSLLVPLWRGPRQELLPWITAGVLALVATKLGLPAPLPLLFGALCGAALGAWQERRRP
ncbi:AzlC family ABC transporter permease [Acetobacteraceae bacterium H6797]|nr:AzlC family ABC transporter permease [Acetobacteraceae bacterium H6797]